jgi:multidrug resistance efflux pump
VVAQQAVVNRLVQLTGFEQITAPFDGVITSRFIDVGSLVIADVASGTPLFSIARTDVLRVQVYVPQTDYFGIKDGDRATVTVPELPDRVFEGKVARRVRALAAGTRTLLTEVDVDNKDGTSRRMIMSKIFGAESTTDEVPNAVRSAATANVSGSRCPSQICKRMRGKP